MEVAKHESIEKHIALALNAFCAISWMSSIFWFYQYCQQNYHRSISSWKRALNLFGIACGRNFMSRNEFMRKLVNDLGTEVTTSFIPYPKYHTCRCSSQNRTSFFDSSWIPDLLAFSCFDTASRCKPLSTIFQAIRKRSLIQIFTFHMAFGRICKSHCCKSLGAPA